jgi:hypothetical protein
LQKILKESFHKEGKNNESSEKNKHHEKTRLANENKKGLNISSLVNPQNFKRNKGDRRKHMVF